MCITFLCKGNRKKNLTLSLNVFSFSVVCVHACMSVHAMCAHVCMCTCVVCL